MARLVCRTMEPSWGGPDRARVVLERLAARGQTLAIAESCTGGLLASTLTDVPGASDRIGLGIVAYGPEAKRDVLGVEEIALADHGGVSDTTATHMAERVRSLAAAPWGVAVVGWAGPTGGTEADPIGTVYAAAVGPNVQRTVRTHIEGTRTEVKRGAVDAALDLLVELLEE